MQFLKKIVKKKSYHMIMKTIVGLAFVGKLTQVTAYFIAWSLEVVFGNQKEARLFAQSLKCVKMVGA